jgi:hypothetical protein
MPTRLTLCTLALSLFACRVLAADGPGREEMAGMAKAYIQMQVGQMERTLGLLLEDEGVPDADKAKLKGFVDAGRARGDELLKQVDADPMAALDAAKGLIRPWRDFLESRIDLYWLFGREGQLRDLEAGLLFKGGTEYLDLIKGLGLDDANSARVSQIIKGIQAQGGELMARAKQAGDFPQPDDKLRAEGDQLLATGHKSIRAELTPLQRDDLDWAILRTSREGDEPMTQILGFSTLLSATHAPTDGMYTLHDIAGKPEQEPPPIKTIELKKGQALGFRKTTAGVTAAFAGDQEVALAGDGPFLWALRK